MTAWTYHIIAVYRLEERNSKRTVMIEATKSQESKRKMMMMMMMMNKTKCPPTDALAMRFCWPHLFDVDDEGNQGRNHGMGAERQKSIKLLVTKPADLYSWRVLVL